MEHLIIGAFVAVHGFLITWAIRVTVKNKRDFAIAPARLLRGETNDRDHKPDGPERGE